MEWVLVLTLNISSAQGTIRDVQMEMVDGFRTALLCESAKGKLAGKLIQMVGKNRERQGIRSNTKDQHPAVNAECVVVKKR